MPFFFKKIAGSFQIHNEVETKKKMKAFLYHELIINDSLITQ